MPAWLALALSLASPQQDDVRVSASLHNSSIVTGATVVVEIRAEMPGMRTVRMDIPPLPAALSIVGTQDFTHDQISMPGGRKRIVQRNLVVLAERPGTFVIPSIPIEIDGTTYRTAPLELYVLAGGTPPPAPLASGGDDIRLVASLDDDTVYVGQQTILEVEALFPRDLRQRQARPPAFETPNPSGFWISELPGGLTGGVRLFRGDVVETQRYRRVYVPLEPGRYALDPVRLRYELRRGHLYAPETRELVTDSLRLTVLPLPERGRPDSFTGAVGRFETTGTLQPASVAAGDAATLSIEITGTGNVKTLPPPRLPRLDGIEIFPPSEDASVNVRGDRLAGTKRFTWVIVPEKPGGVEFGRIEYAFFDPETGRYLTSSTETLRLDVDAPSHRGTADAADTALAPLRMTPAGTRLGFMRSPFFVAAQAVPLFALFAAFALRRRRRAPATAMREVRARWQRALDEIAVSTGEDARAFLGRLAGVLRGGLAELSGRATVRAAPAEAMRSELEAAGASSYAATAAAALLRRIDHIRFGGQDVDAPARDSLIAEARSVLDRVQTELGAGGIRAGATGAIAIALLCAAASGAHAQDDDAGFRNGVGAWLRQDFATAVSAFERHLANAPADEAAWYNLGNAYRGAGDSGRAIWAWRQALELNPRDGAVRRNLRLTSGTIGLTGAPPRIAVTRDEMLFLLTILWWFAAAALCWSVLRDSRRAARVAVGMAVLALLVVLAGLPSFLRRPSAVALEAGSPLLAGPAVRSDTVAVVPAGTPVRVIGQEGSWLRLRTSDHAEGWGSPDRFALVSPAD